MNEFNQPDDFDKIPRHWIFIGEKLDVPRVLVLVEEGSKPASRFRGLVKSYRPRWNEAPFSSREDILMASRQFCWNVKGG